MTEKSHPQNELYKTRCGRWALNGIELTSGSYCDVNIGGHWIRISIEHDGKSYYAVPTGVRLVKGLYARLLGDCTD